ncbi:MAG: hypothetical protein ACI9G1_003528 [Pirellulaceae bacterium]|jgi:uncharacterized protein (TIGR00251 family)
MLQLRQTKSGVILPVKAHPSAKKTEIKGQHAGKLKVSVTQAPEKGKANKAIVEFLAKTLGLKKSQIRILNGETNSEKEFLITGISLPELQAKIDGSSW